MKRRDFLAAGIAFPLVTPGKILTFPADHGAHPDYRQEWWYVTGWLKTEKGEEQGFQITFFRVKPDLRQDNPSAFAPLVSPPSSSARSALLRRAAVTSALMNSSAIRRLPSY